MKHEYKCMIRKFTGKVSGKLHQRISLLVMALMLCAVMTAQSAKITVKGAVIDESGEPLIGASVVEKGTTNGTMTDLQGGYTLSIPATGSIEVSFLGFITQTIPVNNRTEISVTLKEDNQVLDEVVVTALGIKRDRKSLGYALQEVKGEELLKARDPNVANSLTGKIAGLQVKQSASGPSGSSRIVLRGNSSIGGGNQPLIVVDGVPIDGGTGSDNDDQFGEFLMDKGSGMSDISPDDIASISVLKGPAAAALYGSRAGNGVIMITTKTGEGTKGIGISYSTNLTFDSPMMTPRYQNKYGQGTNGKFDAGSKNSWGELMEDGKTVTNHVGKTVKYSAKGAEIEDFLRTGNTWTNSLDIASANEKGSIRAGVMHLSNKGIVPNSDFSKTSATLRGTAKLSSKLSMDAKVSFISQKTNNRPKLGGNHDNIFLEFMRMPRSMQLEDFSYGTGGYHSSYKDIIDPYAYPAGTVSIPTNKNVSGRPISYAEASTSTSNPYFSTYNNTNNDRKKRVIGFASLKYEFTDWLNIQGRYGIDYTSSQYIDIQGTGTIFSTYRDVNGNIRRDKTDGYEMNTDVLLTFNKSLTDKLGLIATAGGNRMYSRTDGLSATANGLFYEYFYSLSNAINPKTYESLYRKKINSVYGTASFSWDNMFYLDVTARNDWSSTLNSDNRSYFYPSVGASWIFTETFKDKLGPVNYGKLRLSWAEVGNDTQPYVIHNYRSMPSKPQDANPSTTEPLFDLKPEKIQSYEIGLEMNAFNNRLGLDFAYYNKDSKNQILRIDVPAGTGYMYKYINAGNVRNSGIELMLRGTPVRSSDFDWDVMLNFAKNKNKIVNLGGYQRQILSHPSYSGSVIVVADAGGAYGDLWGKPYQRDESGQIVVDDQGLPIFESDFVKLGNSNPKWMGGITNSFRYRDFSLSFQVDMSYGGKVFMGSYKEGAGQGTLAFTEAGREEMLVDGVTATGEANAKTTTAQLYWGRMVTGSEPWIYDATNVRLRELTVGYRLPRKLLSNTFLKDVKLSFVGRNLWMIHSKTKGFDPEAAYATGNAQGYELGSMPTLRSLGFNVNVTF